jgi:signal transduction histidine kinase
VAKPLKALIVEDSLSDAELLLMELKRSGYDVSCERVETAEAMRAALAGATWDIILSDYSLPTFSAPEALGIAQTQESDVPFIIISGTIGEETAVSALKAGAHDFLVKGRLARLAPAIERELRDAEARRDRKRLEEQLRHSQKMEAVGQLAGSVAHDFNNVLTSILGFCELALLGVGIDDNGLREDLVEIQRAGERAAGLTRQLLAFSRQQVLQPKIHDLNGLVAGMEPMLRRLTFENIQLTLAIDSEVNLIEIDETQLEQILINLVVNARDAMPQGGTLAVSVSRALFDPIVGKSLGNPSAYVMLSVSDTGIGMDEATKTRIFEPFFTTKGAAGTGLGLATVHRIVKQNNGDLSLISAPGKGTTFRIFLPRAAGESPARSDAHVTTGRTSGSETVLVAEDDPAVRRLAKLSLERNGYHVLEAGNPQEAIRVAQTHSGPIQLLLSDVIMPESKGAPLVERLRTIQPLASRRARSGHRISAEAVHRPGSRAEGARGPRPARAVAAKGRSSDVTPPDRRRRCERSRSAAPISRDGWL